jgi:hypothetical protein
MDEADTSDRFEAMRTMTFDTFLQNCVVDAMTNDAQHVSFTMNYRGNVVEAEFNIKRVIVPGFTDTKH